MTLNRPKALNALNSALFAELDEALHLIDADRVIGAIVITGSERAFAGACTRGVGVVLEQQHRTQPVPILNR